MALELLGHLLATSDLVPRSEGLFSTGLVRALFEPLFGNPRECRGGIAFPPSFGPPRRQG